MIDWIRVAELREEVGIEEFDEVVDLFLEEVEDVVSRLKTSPDPTTYESDLHFLKGSALNLGFSEFGRVCQAGESAAAAGQAGSVDVGRLLACYAQSKDVFLSGLAEGLAA